MAVGGTTEGWDVWGDVRRLGVMVVSERLDPRFGGGRYVPATGARRRPAIVLDRALSRTAVRSSPLTGPGRFTGSWPTCTPKTASMPQR